MCVCGWVGDSAIFSCGMARHVLPGLQSSGEYTECVRAAFSAPWYDCTSATEVQMSYDLWVGPSCRLAKMLPSVVAPSVRLCVCELSTLATHDQYEDGVGGWMTRWVLLRHKLGSKEGLCDGVCGPVDARHTHTEKSAKQSEAERAAINIVVMTPGRR